MKYNELVTKIQQALVDQGEALTVDGVYGHRTSKALEAFDAKIELTRKPVTPVQYDLTTGQDTDEGTIPWYKRMFQACAILEGHDVQVYGAVALCRRGWPHYLDVAHKVGAKNPDLFAHVLAVIHFKEATCDFSACLHNGETIIGTGQKTKLVPRGRGPFSNWLDAAVDAIQMNPKRWERLLAGSDDIGEILQALEQYNGTGYISGAGRAENSPYLWACSNINDGKGKYTADHGFDPNATTLRAVGAAVILKEFYKSGTLKVEV